MMLADNGRRLRMTRLSDVLYVGKGGRVAGSREEGDVGRCVSTHLSAHHVTGPAGELVELCLYKLLYYYDFSEWRSLREASEVYL